MPPPIPRAFPNGLLPDHLAAGSVLFRIHRRKDAPIWFGPAPGKPPSYRFDAPSGEYQTLYAARTVTGAFVETILRKNNRILRREFVELRQWTALQLQRPLQVAKLYDEGLLFHGTSNDICAGDIYTEPRLLARDLYLTFPDLDGIAYRARHNNGELCYALFDRVALADLMPIEARPFANERRSTDAIMRRHGAVWDPTPSLIDPKATP
jgi:hypothetical protein